MLEAAEDGVVDAGDGQGDAVLACWVATWKPSQPVATRIQPTTRGTAVRMYETNTSGFFRVETSGSEEEGPPGERAGVAVGVAGELVA